MKNGIEESILPCAGKDRDERDGGLKESEERKARRNGRTFAGKR